MRGRLTRVSRNRGMQAQVAEVTGSAGLFQRRFYLREAA